jgi:hypothetical protein
VKRGLALFLLLGACIQAQPPAAVGDGDGVLPVLPTSVFFYAQNGSEIQVEVEGTSFGGLAFVLVAGQPDEALAREMAAKGCAEAGGVFDASVPSTFVPPAVYRFSSACQQ